MSLFTTREWWSVNVGEGDETFDEGCMCAGNFGGCSPSREKIVVGSFSGVLRVFLPQQRGYSPRDLLAEKDLELPILQVAALRLESGVAGPAIAVLHPMRLRFFLLVKEMDRDRDGGGSGSPRRRPSFPMSPGGSVKVQSPGKQGISSGEGNEERGEGDELEFGSFGSPASLESFSLASVREHRLTHSAFNMCVGPFGNSGKEGVCVQSVDAWLSFFGPEGLNFERRLPPDYLVASLALTYCRELEAVLLASGSRNLEAFKVEALSRVTFPQSSSSSVSLRRGSTASVSSGGGGGEGEDGQEGRETGERLTGAARRNVLVFSTQVGESVRAIFCGRVTESGRSVPPVLALAGHAALGAGGDQAGGGDSGYNVHNSSPSRRKGGNGESEQAAARRHLQELPELLVLGERSLFVLRKNGKRLIHLPLTDFIPAAGALFQAPSHRGLWERMEDERVQSEMTAFFGQQWSSGMKFTRKRRVAEAELEGPPVSNFLLAGADGQIRVISEGVVVWGAQMRGESVCESGGGCTAGVCVQIGVGCFGGVKGMIVSLSEKGKLLISYLGTQPDSRCSPFRATCSQDPKRQKSGEGEGEKTSVVENVPRSNSCTETKNRAEEEETARENAKARLAAVREFEELERDHAELLSHFGKSSFESQKAHKGEAEGEGGRCVRRIGQVDGSVNAAMTREVTAAGESGDEWGPGWEGRGDLEGVAGPSPSPLQVLVKGGWVASQLDSERNEQEGQEDFGFFDPEECEEVCVADEDRGFPVQVTMKLHFLFRETPGAICKNIRGDVGCESPALLPIPSTFTLEDLAHNQVAEVPLCFRMRRSVCCSSLEILVTFEFSVDGREGAAGEEKGKGETSYSFLRIRLPLGVVVQKGSVAGSKGDEVYASRRFCVKLETPLSCVPPKGLGSLFGDVVDHPEVQTGVMYSSLGHSQGLETGEWETWGGKHMGVSLCRKACDRTGTRTGRERENGNEEEKVEFILTTDDAALMSLFVSELRLRLETWRASSRLTAPLEDVPASSEAESRGGRARAREKKKQLPSVLWCPSSSVPLEGLLMAVNRYVEEALLTRAADEEGRELGGLPMILEACRGQTFEALDRWEEAEGRVLESHEELQSVLSLCIDTVQCAANLSEVDADELREILWACGGMQAEGGKLGADSVSQGEGAEGDGGGEWRWQWAENVGSSLESALQSCSVKTGPTDISKPLFLCSSSPAPLSVMVNTDRLESLKADIRQLFLLWANTEGRLPWRDGPLSPSGEPPSHDHTLPLPLPPRCLPLLPFQPPPHISPNSPLSDNETGRQREGVTERDRERDQADKALPTSEHTSRPSSLPSSSAAAPAPTTSAFQGTHTPRALAEEHPDRPRRLPPLRPLVHRPAPGNAASSLVPDQRLKAEQPDFPGWQFNPLPGEETNSPPRQKETAAPLSSSQSGNERAASQVRHLNVGDSGGASDLTFSFQFVKDLEREEKERERSWHRETSQSGDLSRHIGENRANRDTPVPTVRSLDSADQREGPGVSAETPVLPPDDLSEGQRETPRLQIDAV
uniref:PTHB1 N-terminal domain-containing protein n=1 Tax=Chromera velia CCMP2878 TaxID=1169474 RepID=A0A0G4FL56_9ALVE|eukprot:Cvel_17577.t1-p1 / transcript=Cvel_17577.t1 / gene=Cvel_17577 / organism=Chromera_velia_CCMP2878 / gene_product=Protein PTHB1, putative / transcript_product=Protein PTHB1, putative / location=Cvel_scaffold1412:26874-38716(+) / protein_length=1540 / sequence_SO=supercontig / SO=protein_coding / is_pseudo=false